jgi:hypothetical protein
MTKTEKQALLIFERKIFTRIYGPEYKDGEWKSSTNRELERRKYSKMDTGAKDNLAGSPGENEVR